MALKTNPNINLAGAPVISLGGVEYFVPMLAMRQLRIVVPAVQRLLPAFERMGGMSMLSGVLALSEQDFGDVIAVLAAALSRAYPDATVDDVAEMTVTGEEMAKAFVVIMQQTGMIQKVAPGEMQGEATPPTSTSSSPDTVNIPASPGPTL